MQSYLVGFHNGLTISPDHLCLFLSLFQLNCHLLQIHFGFLHRSKGWTGKTNNTDVDSMNQDKQQRCELHVPRQTTKMWTPWTKTNNKDVNCKTNKDVNPMNQDKQQRCKLHVPRQTTKMWTACTKTNDNNVKYMNQDKQQRCELHEPSQTTKVWTAWTKTNDKTVNSMNQDKQHRCEPHKWR